MMTAIDYQQKLAVLHCAYQLIASADGDVDENRDYNAISMLLRELGFSSVHSWDSSLQLNPHDCFYHISTLSADYKLLFRELMLQVAHSGGNERLRQICAESLFELCQCSNV